MAIVGIILTIRRIRALERQVLVAQEGQITERFTRAIEQLGSDRMEIRLGGIYALERIANDSDKDYWTIMETLTAYVRERAPWQEPPPDSKEAMLAKEMSFLSSMFEFRPATDIQAVLTVLGRRKYWFGQGEDKNLDLRNTDLRGSDLRNAHLENAFLMGSHLEKAYLYGVHFEGAFLAEAHLEGTDLRKSYLKRTFFGKAHMQGALLWGAHMEGVELLSTHLEGALLHEANLEKAFFLGTHLEGAFLGGATGLTWKQLGEAIIDDKTILPDYLREQPLEDKGPEGNRDE